MVSCKHPVSRSKVLSLKARNETFYPLEVISTTFSCLVLWGFCLWHAQWNDSWLFSVPLISRGVVASVQLLKWQEMIAVLGCQKPERRILRTYVADNDYVIMFNENCFQLNGNKTNCLPFIWSMLVKSQGIVFSSWVEILLVLHLT